MAKPTKGGSTTSTHIKKKTRKGTAAKRKTSSNPNSKNYKKPYKGQGRR
jgi:hypothetical protein